MNYLTKRNFGIPATLLAAFSVLLGYGIYTSSFSLVWVALAFTGIVFLFDFDEIVKSTLKQSLTLSFYGWIVNILIRILNSVLGWFAGGESVSISGFEISSGGTTAYKVFSKMIQIVGDLADFAFLLAFAFLLFTALKGKAAKLDLNSVAGSFVKETATCPKCGEKVEKGAAFCTKCGSKIE